MGGEPPGVNNIVEMIKNSFFQIQCKKSIFLTKKRLHLENQKKLPLRYGQVKYLYINICTYLAYIGLMQYQVQLGSALFEETGRITKKIWKLPGFRCYRQNIPFI
jgi:hypothetical protein